MSKIKQKVVITEAEDQMIRREWDKERGRWYFSVADVMAVLTESVDARSYWKTLKARLNKARPELVNDCYQLKLKASDGKSYKVDTADADTLVKIIQVVAPYNAQVFGQWFDHVEVVNSLPSDHKPESPSPLSSPQGNVRALEEDKISTAMEPSVDIYENKSEIVVRLMLAGISPDKIIISVNMHTLTIRGTRVRPESITEENYFYKELMWGEFYKEIELPILVDVDNVEAIETNGLLTIRLPKIDKEKVRYLKIKSNTKTKTSLKI